MSSAADRNLLFGILALQMDFISRDALIAAMHAWVLDKKRTLGDILVEQRALTDDDRAWLETGVQRHLRQHSGDPEQSLAALQPSTPVREPLQQIADGDVQASLAHLAATPEQPIDPQSTTGYTPSPVGERFVILRPHARGGLGQVHVALDQELHRQVALKEMLDEQAHDPDKRSRFVREAEITGGLEHPGIVPVYGLGAYADGRPYYAMRFIKGDSLQQAIKQFHDKDQTNRDPGERALALRQLPGRFVDVCNAIAYAHSRGVLHRDLKPGNVMLGPYGETLVVDWGLAKAIGVRGQGAEAREEQKLATEPVLHPASSPAETLAGSALGTPAYMSPEQASGRLDLLSPASDVYSLGATLYCLLTGQAPFDSGALPDVLQAVQKGTWTPPAAVKPGVPPALAAICRKATALEPGERYPSARALADDVEHWLADEPVVAYAEPVRHRVGRWVRRHKPAVAAIAALAAVVLATGVAWWLVTEARGRADQMATLRDRAEDAERLTRHYRYDAEMVAAQQMWDAGDITRMLESLNSQKPNQKAAEDLRGFEWYYLWHLAHQELLTLKGHQGPVLSVCFSPDGRRLATASNDKTGKVWDAHTGKDLLTLNGHQGSIASVCFSPDGRRLATASSDNAAKIWDAQTGKELLTLKGRQGAVLSVCFSPDGRRLATGSFDNTAKVWDAQTGENLLTLQGHRGPVSSVCFSPDGRRLATASRDWTAKVWDAQTGENLLTLRGHENPLPSVSFSPDGRRLATAGYDNTAKVWDAQTGKDLLTLSGAALSVCFSPDGRCLATDGNHGTAIIWRSVPLSAADQDEADAVALVDALFSRLLLKSDVLQELRADVTLDPAPRGRALALAAEHPENPRAALNVASWAVVHRPGASKEQYRQALRWAEAASRLAPDNGPIVNTLGVAQYRTGQYALALQSLTRSERLNRLGRLGPQPADLAFLAMAQHQLGHAEEARQWLERLRKLAAEPRWTKDAQTKDFLHEAETLLKTTPKAPNRTSGHGR